jgi:hypothetical protein
MIQFVVILLALAGVIAIVGTPLRRPAGEGAGADGTRAAADRRLEVGDLEAAREAKLHEIRDAELDHRTGKLSDRDYEELDRTLRAEAVEILHDLDRIE